MQPPASSNMADQIDAALAAGNVGIAIALSRQSLANGDLDPFACNLVAWAEVEAGNPTAAEALLHEGLANVPGEPGLLSTLGLALRRQGRMRESLTALDAAIAYAPEYAAAWLERGFTLHQGNSLKLAKASYLEAVRLEPGRAAAFAGAAAIAAMSGDRAEARELAGRALALDVADPVAHCAIARCDIAEGKASNALERLQKLLERADLTAENRSAAQSLLGDALARLADPAGAVVAWAAAKADLAIRHPQLAALEPQLSITKRVGRHVAAVKSPWQAPKPEKATRPHAFLLGYPRSGTTLVETILASISGVEALEELPTLADADAAFLLPEDGPQRLDMLRPDDARRYRAAYWQRVADFGAAKGSGLFLDMDPMKGLHLPVIARLFPAAKIVVMRRDPRDVVLSCARQNFAASPIALEFATLTQAALHYDAMMRVQQASVARMENPVLEVRYEALVADFDGVTKALCDFLGLPWSIELRDFGATARRRDVNTASVGQVRAGLFNGGGQWRPFAAEMAPAMPILAPWIEAFGYAD
jgi:cytochrome c-type biogenesis protein CcmH/NrfG